MSKKPFALWTDQDVCDWFDSLDEAYIRSLIDLHDDHDITPRKAFHYVFGDLDSQLCTCQACKLLLSPAPVQAPPSLNKPACRCGACSLPAEVPESETLWAYLSKGYGLDYVRSGLVCGIPEVEREARLLRDRVQRAWARIVSEVQ